MVSFQNMYYSDMYLSQEFPFHNGNVQDFTLLPECHTYVTSYFPGKTFLAIRLENLSDGDEATSFFAYCLIVLLLLWSSEKINLIGP